jgi:hypothetical protein
MSNKKSKKIKTEKLSPKPKLLDETNECLAQLRALGKKITAQYGKDSIQETRAKYAYGWLTGARDRLE